MSFDLCAVKGQASLAHLVNLGLLLLAACRCVDQFF